MDAKLLAEMSEWEDLPEGAKMWVVCERRKLLYPRPCMARPKGGRYNVPNDCPYLETCICDQDQKAIFALYKKLRAEISPTSLEA